MIYILVILLTGPGGGAAIDSKRQFYTEPECTKAADKIRRGYNGNGSIDAECISQSVGPPGMMK